MVTLKAIRAEQTAGLRQSVLRPHQQQKDLVYPNDHHDRTLHVGAFVGENLVGIASIYHEDSKGILNAEGWRLRGMAVLPEYRGKKIGQKLLFECIQHVQRFHGKYVWCNARVSAVRFYESCGFKKRGEQFEIEGIGPHFIMVRENGL